METISAVAATSRAREKRSSGSTARTSSRSAFVSGKEGATRFATRVDGRLLVGPDVTGERDDVRLVHRETGTVNR